MIIKQGHEKENDEPQADPNELRAKKRRKRWIGDSIGGTIKIDESDSQPNHEKGKDSPRKVTENSFADGKEGKLHNFKKLAVSKLISPFEKGGLRGILQINGTLFINPS
jgi:hypothetical protein